MAFPVIDKELIKRINPITTSIVDIITNVPFSMILAIKRYFYIFLILNVGMTKKKKSKKKEKVKSKKVESKKKTKKETKTSKESELEEQVTKQETPFKSELNQFIRIKESTPVLEREIKEPEPTLEQEVGFAPKEEEKERKYDETIKYNLESEYQEGVKRKKEISSENEFQMPSLSSINLERVGRERTLPIQEFHLQTPSEMIKIENAEKYDLLKPGKSKKFASEKTSFQEDLERRYEFN